MFESWVSDLLAGSLGHFINVQRDKLKVSLWNGKGKMSFECVVRGEAEGVSA